MTADALVMSRVSFSYKGRRVLSSISIVAKERRIGIIGANGSGKSTFARLITGLLKPISGSIKLHGVDVWSNRKAALKTVGMIFQNPDHQIIFPTCEEEIAFGLRQLGQSKDQSRAQARKVLEGFDRLEWAKRSTHELSQGQRHILCLMSVLVMQPKVLVLDEPYAGLDLATSMQLHHNLERLKQQIILITHDLDVLSSFDRVIWIDDGMIKADGVPKHILNIYRIEMQARGSHDT